MSDYDIRIVSRLMDALTWEMTAEDVVLGVIDQVGIDEVLGALKLEEILEYIGEEKEPEQIFTQEELEEWARENIDCDEDVPGYEERERY